MFARCCHERWRRVRVKTRRRKSHDKIARHMRSAGAVVRLIPRRSMRYDTGNTDVAKQQRHHSATPSYADYFAMMLIRRHYADTADAAFFRCRH
jgi:hypothetical protein